MSNIYKLPQSAPAAGTGQPKTTSGRLAALPRSDEFLPLTDFWKRSGVGAGSPQEGAATASAPEPRDERELARRQAEEIVRQAQVEAARIEQEAREQGFAQGEAAGRAAGKEEYEARVRDVARFLDALQDQRREVLSRYEREIMTLVTTMVDRLVRHEVSVNPLVIQACLKEAMAFVVENSLVKVHLHSEDLHRIKEISLEDPTLFEGKNRVQLVEDPAISQGGCLLKTSFGEIDATLEGGKAKLCEAVEQAFLAALAADTGAGEPPSS
ncbi:MAG: FliH/SctL family protein [Thermodesulfobacteriota bacterium]